MKRYEVKNNVNVKEVEIIDSEYNDTQTIGNKMVYVYDKNGKMVNATDFKLKHFFSPRKLGEIRRELEEIAEQKTAERASELLQVIENTNYFPLHLHCDAGYGYGEGNISRDSEGWKFSNGKIGGSFEPAEDFILEAIQENITEVEEWLAQ